MGWAAQRVRPRVVPAQYAVVGSGGENRSARRAGPPLIECTATCGRRAHRRLDWMDAIPVPDDLARELLNERYSMALGTNGEEGPWVASVYFAAAVQDDIL